jgi:protocatechuate 3,4-dioxygenase, alpha subunit
LTLPPTPSPTPSQTVGPYYTIGLCRRVENELVPAADPSAIRVTGRLLDGDGEPIVDGMIEAWDATGGRWGRSSTDVDGRFWFVTAKPAAPAGEAPHLDLYVFARGLLKHQLTRMYFPDEAQANASDAVLSILPEADRAVLVAEQEDGAVRFDIRMQGERPTVFFSL